MASRRQVDRCTVGPVTGATCSGTGSIGTAATGGAGASYNQNGGAGGGGGGGGWFTGAGGSSGSNYGGGGGGGAGSSYPGLEVPGGPTASITTAASQTPSVTITCSRITLVFSGRLSADINGPIVAGGLKIASFRDVITAVTGRLVIQTANGDRFQVGVRIDRFFGRYTGQISVSGPGVHTTAIVTTNGLSFSNGLVTGVARGFNGFRAYSLSFTL